MDGIVSNMLPVSTMAVPISLCFSHETSLKELVKTCDVVCLYGSWFRIVSEVYLGHINAILFHTHWSDIFVVAE